MPGGFGRGIGRGRGPGGGGRGMGRGRGRTGFRAGRAVGVPENCICPQCGTVIPHKIGVPCFQTACPNCGSAMTRQFNIPGVHSTDQQVPTGQKPVIDENACTGCRKCIPVCPEHAIEMRNNKAYILAEKCTNCRLCVSICPVSAIN